MTYIKFTKNIDDLNIDDLEELQRELNAIGNNVRFLIQTLEDLEKWNTPYEPRTT